MPAWGPKPPVGISAYRACAYTDPAPNSVINEHHIHGEKNTGFESEAGMGEFECGNCKYFHGLMGGMGACDQTEMMIYSRQPRIPNSTHVLVHQEDCCEYVERVGGKDKDLGVME